MDSLSKDDLIQIIYEMRKHVTSDTYDSVLRKITKHKGPKKRKCDDAFEMKNYMTRHIAIKFAYLGENYQGFQRQDNTNDTIERHLIDSMKFTKLIESIDDVSYSRAGRTDKGVSAFGQVISLRVRSNVPANAIICDNLTIDDLTPGNLLTIQLPCGRTRVVQEIDYCARFNRGLPADIIVRSWAPAAISFDARFSCLYRTYRYFFSSDGLDMIKMKNAVDRFKGEHDFRNFCRVDPTITTTFVRQIYLFRIVEENGTCYFEICGNAFLWHQVRCMVAVLFLVGQGKEEPEIVSQMLNVVKYPEKPQYEMTDPLPLVLYDCFYENIEWNPEPRMLEYVQLKLQHQKNQMALRTQLLLTMLHGVDDVILSKTLTPWSEFKSKWPMRKGKQKPYVPLLKV